MPVRIPGNAYGQDVAADDLPSRGPDAVSRLPDGAWARLEVASDVVMMTIGSTRMAQRETAGDQAAPR